MLKAKLYTRWGGGLSQTDSRTPAVCQPAQPYLPSFLPNLEYARTNPTLETLPTQCLSCAYSSHWRLLVFRSSAHIFSPWRGLLCHIGCSELSQTWNNNTGVVLHHPPSTTSWGLLLRALVTCSVHKQKLWPTQKWWVQKSRLSRRAGLEVHWCPQEPDNFLSVRFPLRIIYFTAIRHLPRTTVCLPFHSHLVRDINHLFLFQKTSSFPGNFPDIYRELPCTSHWLKLDHEPIPEQISSDKIISCADWLRPRVLN